MHFDLVMPWLIYPIDILRAYIQNKVCVYMCMYVIIHCSIFVKAKAWDNLNIDQYRLIL